MRVRLLSLPLALGLLLLAPVGWRAANHPSAPAAAQLRVIPTVPTADDVISITASGWWYCGCTPAYQSHTVDDKQITITALANPDCEPFLPVFTYWEFTVEVGQLASGAYTVTLDIVDCHTPYPDYATEQFTVFENPSKSFLPVVLSYANVNPVSLRDQSG